MQAHLPEKEAIFRFAKIYIAQYLSTIRTRLPTQTISKHLMTRPSICSAFSSSKVPLSLPVMKQLAVKVKNILTLQGRTLPNALHVLVVAHQSESIDFEKLLKFITKSR